MHRINALWHYEREGYFEGGWRREGYFGQPFQIRLIPDMTISSWIGVSQSDSCITKCAVPQMDLKLDAPSC